MYGGVTGKVRENLPMLIIPGEISLQVFKQASVQVKEKITMSVHGMFIR